MTTHSYYPYSTGGDADADKVLARLHPDYLDQKATAAAAALKDKGFVLTVLEPGDMTRYEVVVAFVDDSGYAMTAVSIPNFHTAADLHRGHDLNAYFQPDSARYLSTNFAAQVVLSYFLNAVARELELAGMSA